ASPFGPGAPTSPFGPCTPGRPCGPCGPWTPCAPRSDTLRARRSAVIVCFLSFLPVITPFLIWLDFVIRTEAAVAVPVSAASSATTATIMAGAGRRDMGRGLRGGGGGGPRGGGSAAALSGATRPRARAV